MQRVRYYLVPDIFDTNQFISLLNLPSMTMRKDRASKMHDRLPLLLFQLQNYEILSQNDLFNYSLFILPFSLLLSDLSYEVSYENRILLFHMSRKLFHFIYFSPNNYFYKDQIKYKTQILSDSLSTLISICDILNQNYDQEIHLKRCGINPIEHNFGTIRMR